MGYYKVLEEKMEERGTRQSVVARRLNISERTLRNKLNRKTPFTWEQVCTIQHVFFPDIKINELFKPSDKDAS
ncbi:MAG: helix-turn-helix domain-containing protein [Clostridia bacterium]|jgi:plasmid maintenance system antidote protein VapI|nr:helix-turn-helix domain-containing protein [Clostridia bacterium]